MREPETGVLDTACAKALAQLLLRTESKEMEPTIIKRIVLDAKKTLIDDGYEIEVSGELLHRRIRFLKQELSRPDAGPFERRMWSPPVPSRRPGNAHVAKRQSDALPL
jgi:hypothetical protein